MTSLYNEPEVLTARTIIERELIQKAGTSETIATLLDQHGIGIHAVRWAMQHIIDQCDACSKQDLVDLHFEHLNESDAKRVFRTNTKPELVAMILRNLFELSVGTTTLVELLSYERDYLQREVLKYANSDTVHHERVRRLAEAGEFVYLLESYIYEAAEAEVKHKQQLRVLAVIDAIMAEPTIDVAEQAIRDLKAEVVDSLTWKPWKHNCTAETTNIANEIKANGYAYLLETIKSLESTVRGVRRNDAKVEQRVEQIAVNVANILETCSATPCETEENSY